MRIPYNVIATTLALPLLAPAAAYLALRPQERRGLGQRFGSIRPVINEEGSGPRIWVHASSVGEVTVAESIVDALSSERQVSWVVSTYTRGGYEEAERRLGRRARIILYPLDFFWCVRRSLKVVKPDLYVALETELWPNFIWTAHQMGVKVMLANGRLSKRSIGNYLKFRPLFQSVLASMDMIAMTSERQARRMMELGAPPERIRICKNAKYGNLIDRARQSIDQVEDLRNRLSLNDQTPVFLAGSLRVGEVSTLIEACMRLRRSCPGVVCILAPRHLSRLGHLEKGMRRGGLDFHRWSSLKEGSERRVHGAVLVDTLGDLFFLYALATVVFCGASLVDLGGQNVMEPAAWGKAPLYGPHMDDFEDAVELLEQNGAGIRVTDSYELIEKALWLIQDVEARNRLGQRALEVALSHAGAGRETAQAMLGLLEQG